MINKKFKEIIAKAYKILKWSIVISISLLSLLLILALNTTYDLKDATENSFNSYVDLDLQEYKNANVSERKFIIHAYHLKNKITHNDIEGMRKCMGYMSFEKDETLPISQVLGWCNLEKEKKPEEYKKYFNELEFKDKSITAHSLCKDHIEKKETARLTVSM